MSESDLALDVLETETTGFRSSSGSIIQPCDGRKSWDEPTPLDAFLEACLKEDAQDGVEDWQILKHFCQNAEATLLAKDTLDEILSPGTLAQFEAHRGKTCLLVLGNCPQYNVGMPVFRSSTENSTSKGVDAPTAFTIQALKAVAEEFGPTIGLDVRKACRKEPREYPLTDYAPCRAISFSELRRLLWATKLEMAIAEKQYGITWKYCFAFSVYPSRIASLLGFEPKNIATNSFHIADCGRPEILKYRKWKLAGVILGDIASSLCQLPLYEKSEEHLYNKLAAAIRKCNETLEPVRTSLTISQGIPISKCQASILRQSQTPPKRVRTLLSEDESYCSASR